VTKIDGDRLITGRCRESTVGCCYIVILLFMLEGKGISRPPAEWEIYRPSTDCWNYIPFFTAIYFKLLHQLTVRPCLVGV